MGSGFYDAIFLGLSGALVGCTKLSEVLTMTMCREIDRLLQQLCEAGRKSGYAMVIVGTDSRANQVPSKYEAGSVKGKVPCVVIPAEGQTLQKSERRERETGMRSSGGVHAGERGCDVFEAGGRGEEGVHGAFVDRMSAEMREFECLLQTETHRR